MSANKRKQIHQPKEDLECLETEWEVLAGLGSKMKRGKLAERKKTQTLIVTQLVEWIEKKKEYTPVKEKEFVKHDGAYNYSDIYESIFNHYAAKTKIDCSTKEMVLLMGKTGPRATDTAELCGKTTFMVYFEDKVSEIGGIHRKSAVTDSGVNHPLVDLSSVNSSTHQEISRPPTTVVAKPSVVNTPTRPDKENVHKPHKTIKKSVMPKLNLTLADLLALGKSLPMVNWTPGRIKSLIFDRACQGFAWTEWANVRVNKGTRIGEGGFREAYRCTVEGLIDSNDDVYVLKTFLPHAVSHRWNNLTTLKNDCTEEEACMELNMKAVQTSTLARILSDLFRERILDKEVSLPRYVSSWLVEFSSGGYGTIEEHIAGDFVKYLNNSMDQNSFNLNSDSAMKATAFAHFTYEYGDGSFILTDLQGVGMTLTDREVATKRQFELVGGKGEMVFGAGNMPQALEIFVDTHVCNQYCTSANLTPFPGIKVK